MSYNQGHEGNMATTSTCGVDARSSTSPTTPPPSTPSPPPVNGARARHHARSFSSEGRFLNSNSNDEVTEFPPPSTVSQALPVRARKSPPISNGQIESPPKVGVGSVEAHSRQQSSPPHKDVACSGGDHKEDRLAKLKEAQAQKNRRPKMMRLTPAYSSLPGRSPPSCLVAWPPTEPSAADNCQSEAMKVDGLEKVVFPSKKGEQLSSSVHSEPPTPRLSSSGGDSTDLNYRQAIARRINEASSSQPGVGLQIDLDCIPIPSLQDANGPASTSHLPEMIRDRNGNPIKPSLKSARNSVSHLFTRPGRSDSTPALPSNFRAKSVPTTPTLPKAVHFDSHLEHVKLFKNRQKPTAVSRDGSPEQTETETEEEKDQFPYIWRRTASPSPSSRPFLPLNETSQSKKGSPIEEQQQLILRLPNFPSSTRLAVDREIFLERIFLADDLRSVKGTVRVRNMSFEKWVAIRYTLDYWTTTGEVSAEFSESLKGGDADRFTFSIKLNELLNWPRGSHAHETKSMFLCIRYTVSGAEFWDNNDGQNYQLDFRKRQIPSTPTSTPNASFSAAAQPPRANIAPSIGQGTAKSRVLEMAKRGVHGGPAKGSFAMEDLRRELDRLKSDEEKEDEPANIIANHQHSNSAEVTKRKQSPPASPNTPSRSSSPTPWTARYDFGTSLRNSRSGSRTTGRGRAAALDYFSAKPTTRSPTTSISNDQDQFVVNVESPMNRGENVNPSVRSSRSPDFAHRFGMISPGLENGHVEHQPVSSFSSSNNSSLDPSPSTTPPGTLGVPRNMGRGAVGERFYSFPPNRHSPSPLPSGDSNLSVAPVVGAPFFEDAVQAEARGSPIGSPVSSRRATLGPQPLTQAMHSPNPSKLVEAKANALGMTTDKSDGGLIIEDYSPSASPVSPCGSPNPFSPSVSVSSVESDTTVSLSTPDGHSRETSSASSINAQQVREQQLSRDVSRSLTRIVGSTTPEALNGADAEPRFRPASMSDYQELINRFCWNSELVPSGGSTVRDLPSNSSSPNRFSPPLSGATTPTLC